MLHQHLEEIRASALKTFSKAKKVPRTPEEWWEKNRNRFRGLPQLDRDRLLELVFEIWIAAEWGHEGSRFIK